MCQTLSKQKQNKEQTLMTHGQIIDFKPKKVWGTISQEIHLVKRLQYLCQ